MREILFRGKRLKDKKWIEGSLLVLDADSGYYFITEPYKSASTLPVKDLIYNHTHLVNPETVCQYTGLTDKNGVKIFENDVVFVTDDNGCSGQVDTGVGEIDFLEGLWYISGSVQNSLYDIDKCFQIEVIGNRVEPLESEVRCE